MKEVRQRTSGIPARPSTRPLRGTLHGPPNLTDSCRDLLTLASRTPGLRALSPGMNGLLPFLRRVGPVRFRNTNGKTEPFPTGSGFPPKLRRLDNGPGAFFYPACPFPQLPPRFRPEPGTPLFFILSPSPARKVSLDGTLAGKIFILFSVDKAAGTCYTYIRTAKTTPGRKGEDHELSHFVNSSMISCIYAFHFFQVENRGNEGEAVELLDSLVCQRYRGFAVFFCYPEPCPLPACNPGQKKSEKKSFFLLTLAGARAIYIS